MGGALRATLKRLHAWERSGGPDPAGDGPEQTMGMPTFPASTQPNQMGGGYGWSILAPFSHGFMTNECSAGT